MVGQFIGIVLLTGLLGFILLNNVAPFGVTVEYASDMMHPTIADLGPKNRVSAEMQNGVTIYRQTHDLIYFTTKMPFVFDTATVTMTFQNADPEQNLSVGFQDQTGWHYSSQLFDAPLLNSLSWQQTGHDPVLYQKTKQFETIDDFLAHPPQNALIGTFNYNSDIGRDSPVSFPNYQPAKHETVISTPLRGKHVLYAYLQNEPFDMTVEKQDMNWYEDPDPMTVQVYKDNSLVYQTQVDDDGVADNSRKTIAPQTIEIKNPGPGLPENGIYKIIIDANPDTIIKKITTNLQKIVFQGQLFLAGNHDVYSNVIASTSATTVYTNALTITGLTYHINGEQTLQVGNQAFALNTIKSPLIFVPKDNFSKIIVPKNDVILGGFQGYFSFSPDQFFLPNPYHVVPITSKEQLDLVDYILTDYVPVKQTGDWKEATRTFDLRTATVTNGKLSWLISAPGLQSNNRQIVIKSIDVTMSKKGWL